MSTVDFFLQLAHCTLIEQIVVALIAYLHTGTLVVVPQVESLEVFWDSYSDCGLEEWQGIKMEICF